MDVVSASRASARARIAIRALLEGNKLADGTAHIGLMLQKDRGTSRNFYSEATRVALDPDRLTAQKCARCSYQLTQTYLCLQCPNVHCPPDAEAHFKEEGHSFGGCAR
jgi:ubiquitin carboxyl-terminal hydrolase 22/27/51